MKKKSIIIGLFIVILICFSGCSKSGKKDQEVFDDIKKNDSYCSSYDFQYDSMEIIKRMTDEEKKLDRVWVNYKCHNDSFQYSVECVVKYVLYNDGWVFEDYEILNSSYKALKKPNEKKVFRDFPELEFESVEAFDGGDNEYSFVGFREEVLSEVFSWDLRYEISYEFTPESGWVGNIVSEKKDENWKWKSFLGEWSCEDGNDEISNINIKKINSENITVEYYSDLYEERYSDTFDMEYKTGATGVLGLYDFPDDIPIYEVHIFFQSDGEDWSMDEGCLIYFTPYGIYDYIKEVDGEIEYGSEYIKVKK